MYVFPFVSLEWKKGSSYIVQGIRNNATPKYAFRGGNGTFRCYDPPELHIKVSTPYGNMLSDDIMATVKDVNSWQKFTKKRYDELAAKLEAVNMIAFNENGDLNNPDILLKV
ncbi:MAG: hypothetical protein IJ809_06610 [Clostridia bacterium]|nr:hypothetical protein [Clostridia bacterium]